MKTENTSIRRDHNNIDEDQDPDIKANKLTSKTLRSLLE